MISKVMEKRFKASEMCLTLVCREKVVKVDVLKRLKVKRKLMDIIRERDR